MRTVTAKTLSLMAVSMLLLSGCKSGEPQTAANGGDATASVSVVVSAGTSSSNAIEVAESPEPTDTTTSSAASADSDTQNYSGGSKAPVGEYRAADEHGPAQNVPVSVEPEGMHVESEDGLFAFLGYWNETVNYGLQTGDFSYTSPLVADTYTSDIELFAWTEDLYRHGGWTAGGLRSIVVGEDLLINHGDGKYTWAGNLIIEDAYSYYNGEVGFTSGEGTEYTGIYFEIDYVEGKWVMKNMHVIES